MTAESIENLIYLVKNFPKHELALRLSIIGDIYMNDLRDFEKALMNTESYLTNIVDLRGSLSSIYDWLYLC